MEAALSALAERDQQVLLRVTRTALKIAQNLLSDPDEAKYKRVRTASKYVAQPGARELLEAMGFQEEEEHLVLANPSRPNLIEMKRALMAARRLAHPVLGWEVPAQALRFSKVLGSSCYGDIFQGRLDGQEVLIKTLKPDCGQAARDAFDRELSVLCKVSHPHIVELCGLVLASEPTNSIVMEFLPDSLLDILHRGELSDSQVVSFARQSADAMAYLHCEGTLHCGLAARSFMLCPKGSVKLTEFGRSRQSGSLLCRVAPALQADLPVRWTAPDTFKELFYSKASDVWSFGVLLYELTTGGSVPYASFSNTEVKAKVLDGYRLSQPQGCPDDVYSLMLLCWAQRPCERPAFSAILASHLQPLSTRLASGEGKVLSRQQSEDGEKSNTLPKGTKRPKVKELSYCSVAGKGGGLVRLYTALVSPFLHRVVIVCSKKTTVSEAVQTALAKCGKHDLDTKHHGLALVSGSSSGSPACYLEPDKRLLSVRAPPTGMLVLCVVMPGPALLDIIDNIRQNPAYGAAFDPRSRGYLVLRKVGEGSGQPRAKDKEGHRHWCLLEGSTLLCYQDEEDEGVKQFQSFIDLKGCTVSLATSKKGTQCLLQPAEGNAYLVTCSDKAQLLQWMQAFKEASPRDASPLLLLGRGGAVLQASLMDCQEFAYEGSAAEPLRPVVHRRLGPSAALAGSFAAVDYGKHWTVLKTCGLIQCLENGRPETLLSLYDCRKVRVRNPQELREGAEFSIEVELKASRLVLRADGPSEHGNWVLALEQVLRLLHLEDRLTGHRNRESSYIALKRQLMRDGGGGAAPKTYSLPRCFDEMEDLYEPTRLPAGLQRNSPPTPGAHRSGLLLPAPPPSDNTVPLPPRDYMPPPIPPREEPPPLPPKSRSSSSSRARSPSIASNASLDSVEPDDDYILMQPGSVPSPSPSRPVPPRHHVASPSHLGHSPSQPITIPNRGRTGKRSALLRQDSESSSYAGSPPVPTSSLGDLQENIEWAGPAGALSRHLSTSSTHSLPHRHTPLPPAPPLPPRMGERCSGYNSPMLGQSPSPGLQRSHSSRLPRPHPCPSSPLPPLDDLSLSDGMAVSAAQQALCGHPVSKAGSVPRSWGSDGYGSSCSLEEPCFQPLPKGWQRAFSAEQSRFFFFNRELDKSTWHYQEVLTLCQREPSPGAGWKPVRMEDGQLYYYHQRSRQVTWNVHDTFA